MRYTLIGDVHGKPSYLTPDFLEPYSIQVGDLDMEFKYSWAEGFEKPRFFIDGNHEHFPTLNLSKKTPYPVRGNLWHLPRGFLCDNVLFIGGGVSIDQHERKEGSEWFREEEPPYMLFRNLVYNPELEGRVRVIISHEAPYEFIERHFGLLAWQPFYHTVSQALQALFDAFRPELWIFGHYHRSKEIRFQGCQFVCLDICEKKEFDLPMDLRAAIEK